MLSSISWYHLCSIRPRSLAVILLESGNAAAAASMVACVSSLSASGTVPMTFPQAGSTTANDLHDLALTHLPLMYVWFLSSDGSLSDGAL